MEGTNGNLTRTCYTPDVVAQIPEVTDKPPLKCSVEDTVCKLY